MNAESRLETGAAQRPSKRLAPFALQRQIARFDISADRVQRHVFKPAAAETRRSSIDPNRCWICRLLAHNFDGVEAEFEWFVFLSARTSRQRRRFCRVNDSAIGQAVTRSSKENVHMHTVVEFAISVVGDAVVDVGDRVFAAPKPAAFDFAFAGVVRAEAFVKTIVAVML